MPRPVKRRLVCSLPEYGLYGPVNHTSQNGEVIMTVEELETIRVIDYEGLDQEQCAERMEVARSTVQRIYFDARRKIAESLIEGKALRITGGNYSVCTEKPEHKGCGKCRRHGRHMAGSDWNAGDSNAQTR